MNDLAPRSKKITAMSASSVQKVRELESKMLERPQVNVVTRHLIHAGVYHRTLTLPATALMAGALIKRSTTLIVSGDVTIYIDDEPIRFTGYHVLPASAGRKQAMYAHEETSLTMLFATSAKTVEEAEREFTHDTGMLGSRKDIDDNIIEITGE